LDVQNIAVSFKHVGFGIDSMHNFKDLLGGQSDTGDEESLVIWTVNGVDLNNRITTSRDIIASAIQIDHKKLKK
jgi:hypothetical protein